MKVADEASARCCVCAATTSVAFESQSQSFQQNSDSIAMFLTHEDWGADGAARDISAPFLPWKVLTMTAVESTFMVKADMGKLGGPETWLISGISALLDLTNQLDQRVRKVFLFFESDQEREPMPLTSVTEIRDIAERGELPLYVYRGADKQWRQMPCSVGRASSSVAAKEGQLVFRLPSPTEV
ncbi:hypothetical protein NDK50_01570 [Paraburkholderia bryophila]|uniref:hypothetical protein n=1 Tax=Paraburkholderia bryophila TaxID=420952 RepID=UPI00234A1D7B|nr:hypothetical protein [Paraburkholderia bryophila]WCM20195.1 hypothetical protein NDK50_01570 [Paraburkholderia bryophila]